MMIQIFLYKLGFGCLIVACTVHVIVTPIYNKAVEYKNVIVKELVQRPKEIPTKSIIITKDTTIYKDTIIYKNKFVPKFIALEQKDSIFVKSIKFDSTCKCGEIVLDDTSALVVINKKTYFKDNHKKGNIKVN